MNSDSNDAETLLKTKSEGPSGRIYRFEGYELDCARWQLRWQGEAIAVHRKSFDLLLYLLTKRPAVVSKDELLARLWPDQFVEENNLAQQVSALRKALSRQGSGQGLIETIPGRGYRFTADVSEASAQTAHPPAAFVFTADQSTTRITVEEELQSEPGDAPDTTLPATGTPRTGAKVLLVAVGALLVVGVVAGLVWNWWQNYTSGPPVQVVLMNLEGGTADPVLDQALNDAVRFDLSQSPFVTVVSPSVVANALRAMRHEPSQSLTPQTANEVCERTNSQAVIHTTLARAGRRFLLTGRATSCVDGSLLASATQEAARTDDLRLAINRLIEHLRTPLGESRRSVARFTTPRHALQTTSLDALKAASLASVLQNQGKSQEAVVLLRQALAYDPNFTEALYDLSSTYISVHDNADARASIQKAYDLKNDASPFLQLAITERYSHLVTGNLYEAERNANLWTELFPRSAVAWNALANVRKDLGNFTGAAQAAGHAVQLRPDIAIFVAAHAQEQMRSLDYGGARASCARALSMNPDFDFAHTVLLRLAFTLGDSTLEWQQFDWQAAHPDHSEMFPAAAEIAIAEGRFKQGKDYLLRFASASAREGSEWAASDILKQIAREMLVAGNREDGEKSFRQQPFSAESPDDLVTLAILGEPQKAQMLFRQLAAQHPQDTLLRYNYGPLLEGWIALLAGKPEAAEAALNQLGVLDGQDAQIPLLRGEAYLAGKQFEKAQIAFHRVVDHPELEHSAFFTVGWLGLARALAGAGDRSAATSAYQRFLSICSHADAGAVAVQAAQKELSVL